MTFSNKNFTTILNFMRKMERGNTMRVRHKRTMLNRLQVIIQICFIVVVVRMIPKLFDANNNAMNVNPTLWPNKTRMPPPSNFWMSMTRRRTSANATIDQKALTQTSMMGFVIFVGIVGCKPIISIAMRVGWFTVFFKGSFYLLTNWCSLFRCGKLQMGSLQNLALEKK